MQLMRNTAGVIQHVLIGTAFRAAVRRQKLQRLVFADTASGKRFVLRLPPPGALAKLDIAELAVHFVCRSKQHGKTCRSVAHCFQNIERAQEIGFEIRDGILQTGRNSHLRRQMIHSLRRLHRTLDLCFVAHIRMGKPDAMRKPLLQFGNVAFNTGTAQVI